MKRATITDGDGRPKLHRYYLLGSGKTFGIFLHHFVGSDAPDLLHDHPWTWGLALVLRRGYVEERCTGANGPTTRRVLRPGRLNLLRPGVFHRVELRDARPSWSLFVHAREVRRWGFLDRITGAFELWKPGTSR